MDSKEFFVDLALFVMSYINGSDSTWMQDYKKGAKTIFKEENKQCPSGMKSNYIFSMAKL